jgi:lipoyl(octanoyl) transferase
MELRLIIDSPAPGQWNMAMDEALMHSAGRAGQGGSLRFYFWDVPTLSLGYFQSHADRAQHAASRDCPLVRRSTGGGAIVHARELTYSLAVPAGIEADAAGLYTLFHQTLIDELATRSLRAALCHDPPRRAARQEPFLCFLRRAEGDVVLGGHKVAGSAQRRHRRGVLQHGSVLLQTTPDAPELPGIEEIAHVQIDSGELIERWAQRIGRQMGASLVRDRPSDSEICEAEHCLRDKFSHPSWTCRR